MLALDFPKMPDFAQVIPDRAGDRMLDYRIPERLASCVAPGSRVRIPVRTRLLAGTVVSVSDTTAFQGVRDLHDVIGTQPLIRPHLLKLAHWLAEYYCCPLEAAMACVLPQAVRGGEVTPRMRRMVRAAKPITPDDVESLARRAPRQAAALAALGEAAVPVSELADTAGVPPAVFQALEKLGWAVIESAENARDPHGRDVFLPTEPLALSDAQGLALEAVNAAIADPPSHRPILLHGVTGSGKTEVYLQAIQNAIDRGRSALVLVPEISLTPQTVERFKARFAARQNEVAVLHSHLSDGERHDEWHKVHRGQARIVIGARSAVFAPVDRLGVIIVDEEHEGSYKQEDAPRYHARDVAVLRAARENCAIVLGSATPSLESCRNARTGKYHIVRLDQRVDNRRMPVMRIVDMRRSGARRDSIFSPQLSTAIESRLAKGEQTILFLNRRGFSTSMVCQACGHICQCPNCSVSLTYHRDTAQLACHICGRTERAPKACPHCKDPGIRHSGVGTQKVEDSTRKIFPKARIARMDADAMTRKDAYRETLGAFKSGSVDILVGTQMIAKGLDFPNVTLVGIVNADLGLHVPDFRAGERTFQLLTQVAGRAGRGDVEGEVIVQTFTPFSPSIQFARHHDFDAFVDQELEFRERFQFPPFARMVLLTVRGPMPERAEFTAQTLVRRLKEAVPPGTLVGEAAPAPLEKAHGQHRFQTSLRGPAIRPLSVAVRRVIDALPLPENVFISVDVDPVSLL